MGVVGLIAYAWGMIGSAYRWAFQHFISKSDPERAHHLGLGAIALAGAFAPTRGLMRATVGHLDPRTAPTRVVDNQRGLSAPTRVVDMSARYIPLAVSTAPSRCQ